jgi:hypothetical protein
MPTATHTKGTIATNAAHPNSTGANANPISPACASPASNDTRICFREEVTPQM